jgi:hypothetical protein
MTATQTIFSLNANEATDVPHQDVATQPQTNEAIPQLKRRVRDTGIRHGRATGNAGLVVTSYCSGFVAGFKQSLRD